MVNKKKVCEFCHLEYSPKEAIEVKVGNVVLKVCPWCGQTGRPR